MKKITFEEYLKLSDEEKMRLCGSDALNEEERVEVENPLANIAHESVDAYLRGLGFITLKELNDKIEDKLDEIAERRDKASRF